MNSSDLLPCKCGSRAKIKRRSDKNFAWIECVFCIRELQGAGKTEVAIGWNAWMEALADDTKNNTDT